MMQSHLKTILAIAIAALLSGCTAVSVATTAVGVGVGVASTGVRVGVGTTVRAADLIIPDRETCDEKADDSEAAEDEDCDEVD